ncbi:MAG: Nif3-like dinuclear metal center hexameric protein [Bacteroidota bacterium]
MISLITFLLPLFFTFNIIPMQDQSKKTLTAGEVVERIKTNVNCNWRKETVDTYKSGNAQSEITGIATTFMATLKVLKEAKIQGCNMIITHEPTFYNHLDDKNPLKNDPVQLAKLRFIEENNMVVFRFHDHWHETQPDGIYLGVIDAFGWKHYQQGEEPIFKIPTTNVSKLAKDIADKFKTNTVRVVGDPTMKVTTVGMVLGAAGSNSQIAMLNEKEIEVAIVGESREWETVEYVRDANELGMSKALIVMGHADSEEAGMVYCAEWLKGFVKEVPVKFIAAGNPLWGVE